MIRQGVFSRRHSIDILEGLDLDYLNVNHAAAAAAAGTVAATHEFGNFTDGAAADFGFEQSHLLAASQLILGADDDIIGMGMGTSYLPQAGGGTDWYERPPLPTGPFDPSGGAGGLHRPRRNSLHSGDLKDWNTIDYSEHIIASSQIFDDEIDLSMYEMMAADLERTGKGNNKKGSGKPPGSANNRQGNRTSSPAGETGIDAKTPGSSSDRPSSVSSHGYYGDPSSSAVMMKSSGLTPMLVGMGHNKMSMYSNNGMLSIGGMGSIDMNGAMMSGGPGDMGLKYGYSSVMTGGPALLQNEDGTYVKMPADYIGAYSPQSRRARIERFLEKRSRRVWTKKVKYDVRKNFADSRLRVKGRFVKKEDEELMRELKDLSGGEEDLLDMADADEATNVTVLVDVNTSTSHECGNDYSSEYNNDYSNYY